LFRTMARVLAPLLVEIVDLAVRKRSPQSRERVANAAELTFHAASITPWQNDTLV
jgi:hypothetical protein